MSSFDFGIDKTKGLACMVQFAREQQGQTYERYLQKLRGMTFKAFVSAGTPLTSASNYGFSPLDALRERISWTMLRKKYTVKDIVSWGMTFQTAVKVGLKPAHLGGDKGYEVVRDMGATEEEVKEFLFNFEALKSSGFTPKTLKTAGFTMHDLVEAGCSAKNMRQLEGFDIKSIVLNFRPTAEDWLAAGFDDENVKAGGWDASLYRRFVASQTCFVTPAGVAEPSVIAEPSVKRNLIPAATQATPKKVVTAPTNLIPKVAPKQHAVSSLGSHIDTKKLMSFKLDISKMNL